MSIYLHKILPVFFLPTGVVLLLLLAGLIWRRRSLLWSGCVVLWLCSMPFFSQQLMALAERGWVRLAAQDMPAADAIVVLGEGRSVAPGPAAFSEWTDGDRFWGGVALYQAGRAPLLVFTGGWLPWLPAAKTEGEVMVGYATRLGIAPAALRTTGRVANTAEEAVAVAALPDRPATILLVTSAFHMARAQALFESQGLRVLPYPVDFKVDASRIATLLDFLPGARALELTETALREFMGRAYYWRPQQETAR